VPYRLQLLRKSVSFGGVANIEDAMVDQVQVREIVEGLIDQNQEKKTGKLCDGCDYFQIYRFREKKREKSIEKISTHLFNG
jgi:hypothetical protein